ncbi:MAG: aminoacyl-tRNA hydrolase [Proteobacteria bacterium]|nr:aminoacyl-tRNA hydrolase [Pseudomonadota bacterium]NBX86715.1 aminoacyl-tRNA hydrolase [Pseudomonadota bacterium]
MEQPARRFTSQALLEKIAEWRVFAASGPGGQHVNKTASAVQLRLAVERLGLLPLVMARLQVLAGSRLTEDGLLCITAQAYRSQERNKADALQRAIKLLEQAHKIPKKRRATRPTKASRERRLGGKKIRSGIKAARGRVRE